MNTKNIPPLITLIAGLIVVILMYIRHYELITLLWVLLLVLVVFYIIGLLIKKMLDTFGMQIEQAEKEREQEKEKEEEEKLLAKGRDGAVIEKQ